MNRYDALRSLRPVSPVKSPTEMRSFRLGEDGHCWFVGKNFGLEIDFFNLFNYLLGEICWCVPFSGSALKPVVVDASFPGPENGHPGTSHYRFGVDVGYFTRSVSNYTQFTQMTPGLQFVSIWETAPELTWLNTKVFDWLRTYWFLRRFRELFNGCHIQLLVDEEILDHIKTMALIHSLPTGALPADGDTKEMRKYLNHDRHIHCYCERAMDADFSYTETDNLMWRVEEYADAYRKIRV